MTQVKICGLSTGTTLNAALDAGADYVGLVFFTKSPRNVGIDLARELAGQARGQTGSQARLVALAVNPDAELLTALNETVKPDIVQLHGHETPKDVADVRAACQGLEIWKAVPVMTADDIMQAETKYLAPGSLADRLLFDAKPPQDADLPGGNGLTFDWRILEGVAGRHPFALAGGLTAANVADAIRLTRASIVDVSSGVETAPGKKSPELMTQFIKAVRSASANSSSAA